MALYNNGYPTTNQQYYPQYQQPLIGTQMSLPQQHTQNNNTIIWVQGIEGAKAYPVAPNTSLLLMDSDDSCMYIKSADQSGMPSLRIFDYTERTQSQAQSPIAEQHTDIDLSGYITRDEFEKRIAELSAPKKTAPIRKEKENA